MQGNTLEKMANSTIDRPWGIGGSDIGAIVGLSPYKSAVDVWLEKVGRASLGSPNGLVSEDTPPQESPALFCSC